MVCMRNEKNNKKYCDVEKMKDVIVPFHSTEPQKNYIKNLKTNK